MEEWSLFHTEWPGLEVDVTPWLLLFQRPAELLLPTPDDVELDAGPPLPPPHC